MAGATTRLALPYPVPDDTTDVPRDVKALAERLDIVIVTPDPGDLKFSARTGEHGAWIKADGRALATGVYPALRAALIADGSPFGDEGGNPKLPDMRGRAPVGAGAGPGLTARSASDPLGGAESHALTAAQLPAHTHSGATAGMNRNASHAHFFGQYLLQTPGSGVAFGANFGGVYHADATGSTDTNHEHTFTTGGGNGLSGSVHNNMQPYAVGTWFIYTAA